MPTGTGKTEVMLATTVQFANRGTVLVVVPSAALRDQTAGKLLTLGLLRDLGVIPEDTPNPIVGIIAHRPKNKVDLAIFQRCHVVVATMASLTQGTADPLLSKIASCVETLVIDEAHHIAAATWSQFREAILNKRILQLTRAITRTRENKRVSRGVGSTQLNKGNRTRFAPPVIPTGRRLKTSACLCFYAIFSRVCTHWPSLKLSIVRCLYQPARESAWVLFLPLAPRFSGASKSRELRGPHLALSANALKGALACVVGYIGVVYRV